MPYTEPNSLPEIFDDWQEWRARYQEFVALYNDRKIDRNNLRHGFRILGYAGADLENELNYCLEQRG